VNLRCCMSKIRESRGDRQLEVNAPYLSHSGDLYRVTGDGMPIKFASAVDAVTFAVGTRAARCLRFCETDPPCDGCFFIWKRLPRLLK
jgi:hypothetical protein